MIRANEKKGKGETQIDVGRKCLSKNCRNDLKYGLWNQRKDISIVGRKDGAYTKVLWCEWHISGNNLGKYSRSLMALTSYVKKLCYFIMLCCYSLVACLFSKNWQKECGFEGEGGWGGSGKNWGSRNCNCNTLYEKNLPSIKEKKQTYQD